MAGFGEEREWMISRQRNGGGSARSAAAIGGCPSASPHVAIFIIDSFLFFCGIQHVFSFK